MATTVILKKNVPNLGSLGDTVSVKGGYARNFLIPQGYAVEANRKNLKEIEHEKKRLEKEIRTLEQQAQIMKAKIEKITLDFTRKASATGKLFGSVTNREIASVLAERGIELDRRNIKPSNLKELGDNTVEVKLFRSIKAAFTVKLIAEVIEEEVEEEVVETEEEVNTENQDVENQEEE